MKINLENTEKYLSENEDCDLLEYVAECKNFIVKNDYDLNIYTSSVDVQIDITVSDDSSIIWENVYKTENIAVLNCVKWVLNEL